MAKKAKNNRTITILEEEVSDLSKQIKILPHKTIIEEEEITNKIICNNLFDVIDFLPSNFADLIIIDPPYNLTKNFNGFKFKETSSEDYIKYLESWVPKIIKVLKPNGTIYFCCDWKSSAAVYIVLSRYMKIQNRITWQREKGRGSLKNWKNCLEDIWFATLTKDYYFNVEAVKIKRRVIAPYKEEEKPKDWYEEEGEKFRITYPSNFWDDITIPFWSMPENTPHPTQKPEKLIAKLILASSPPGGVVFDPFVGSGTTAVVAKKLGRKYCGIEFNLEYCLIAQKRLILAEKDKRIQGYEQNVFWERNTLKYVIAKKN